MTRKDVPPEIATAHCRRDCRECPHYLYPTDPRYCDRKGKVYKLVGECIRCGGCCSKYRLADRRMVVGLDCPFLVREGDKTSCSIYDDMEKRRRMGCDEFPVIYDFLQDLENSESRIVPESCGYKLVEIT